MLQVDRSRLDKQIHEIDNKWRHSKKYGASFNGCGVFQWPTGMGKTYAACLLINKVLEKNVSGEVVVLVPIEKLVSQWERTIKAECGHFADRVKVMTVQYYKYHNLRLDVLLAIIDEFHLFYSEERMKLINKQELKYVYILGLTATPIDPSGRHKEAFSWCPVISVITYEEARKNGWISDIIEFNIAIRFSPREQQKYDNYTEIVDDNMNKFGGDSKAFGLASKCLQGDKNYTGMQYATAVAKHHGYKEEVELFDTKQAAIRQIWTPGKVIGYARLLMSATRRRGELLANAQAKYDAIVKLVSMFPDKKTVIFSESTKFADRIGAVINTRFKMPTLLGDDTEYCVVYHSRLKPKILTNPKTGKPMKYGLIRLKQRAMDRIINGKSMVLASAKALDAGLDIPDVKLGIVAGASTNPNQQTQREGRTRRKFENEKAIVCNLYIEGTKEESNLRWRQKYSTSTIHWVDSVDVVSENYTRSF